MTSDSKAIYLSSCSSVISIMLLILVTSLIEPRVYDSSYFDDNNTIVVVNQDS